MMSISKLRSKQKMLIIAGSLLLGLALTPAAHAEHHGNRHAEKNSKHHNNGHTDRRYYVVEERHGHGHGHGHKHKHRKHYRQEPRYVVINNNDHHYYSEPSKLQIGVHTGDFDIMFRD